MNRHIRLILIPVALTVLGCACSVGQRGVHTASPTAVAVPGTQTPTPATPRSGRLEPFEEYHDRNVAHGLDVVLDVPASGAVVGVGDAGEGALRIADAKDRTNGVVTIFNAEQIDIASGPGPCTPASTTVPAPADLLEWVRSLPLVDVVETSEVSFSGYRGHLVEYRVLATASDASGSQCLFAENGVMAGVTAHPFQLWQAIVVDFGDTSIFMHVKVSEASTQLLASLHFVPDRHAFIR